MKIYTMTERGYAYAHTTRNADTPEWKVIYYLAKRHSAAREKILEETGASIGTLAHLAQLGLIKLDER